jgi:hypothetical protein
MEGTSWITDRVEGVFDARLIAITANGWGDYLDISEPGVQLLLGRNGSGKSRLLRGISHFWSRTLWTLVPSLANVDDDSLSRGTVGAVFDLPSDSLMDMWSTLLKESQGDEWLDAYEETVGGFFPLSRGEALQDVFDLPALRTFVSSAAEDTNGRVASGLPSAFRSLLPDVDAVDALRRFGFSEAAILHWKERDELGDGALPSWSRTKLRTPNGRWNRMVDIGPPTSFNHRDFAVSFFLHCIADSTVAVGSELSDEFVTTRDAVRAREFENRYLLSMFEDEDIVLSEERTTNSARWIIDPSLSAKVGRAYEELIRTSEKVLVRDHGGFSFLAPYPESGPLFNFLNDQRDRHSRNAALADQLRPVISFPDGLMFRRVLNGIEYVSTSIFDLRLRRGVDELNEGHIRVPFIAVNLDVDDKTSMDRLVANAFNDLVTSRNRSFREDEDFLHVEGFDDLVNYVESLGEDLADCEIGIGGLRVRRPSGVQLVTSGEQGNWGLEWRTSYSENWLDLDAMSKGQRDALLLLLAIGRPADPSVARPYHQFRSVLPALRNVYSQEMLVLADEFDRHLHPTASRRLLEKIHRCASDAGVRVVVSTHSVASLDSPLMRQARRIFASRTVEGDFTYGAGNAVDRLLASEILGVDLIDSHRLASAFLLVEGEHDEQILIRAARCVGEPGWIDSAEFVNGRGIWAFVGIWENVLRFLNAPVFVVYDKRNQNLEAAWNDYKSLVKRGDSSPDPWNRTIFRKMLSDVYDRRRNRSEEEGDRELEGLLCFLRSVLESKSVSMRNCVERVHLLGLACDDIVDLLPINAFPKASSLGGDWASIRANWLSGQTSRPKGAEFKRLAGIDSRSIQSALEMLTCESLDPELRRVLGSIWGHLRG